VIETGTIQQIPYGFLLVLYRIFVRKHAIFEIFTFEKIPWPWNRGLWVTEGH